MGQQLTELKGTVGQHVLTSAGVFGIPVINVENACSGGSTALRGALLEVASGNCDIALALGVEKLFCGDSAKSAQTMAAGTVYAKFGFMFVALYAMQLKKWMENSGATKEHFAKVTAKNTYNGSLNPKAQFQKPMSVEQVLGSRVIAEPLTQFMCSTMADGAAAAPAPLHVLRPDALHRYLLPPVLRDDPRRRRLRRGAAAGRARPDPVRETPADRPPVRARNRDPAAANAQDDLVLVARDAAPAGDQDRAADATAQKLAAARSSSAGRAAPSIARARQMHAADQARQNREARVYIERARGAEAAGKANVARIYYEMAARRASGDLRTEILKRLNALQATP